MEGDSNNINEERRGTPNPSRRNSYNSNHYRSPNQSNRKNSKNYYHKHCPPRQRQHLRFKISHRIIFQTFSCLYYAIAHNLLGPGLKVYLIIKMTLAILRKKYSNQRDIL